MKKSTPPSRGRNGRIDDLAGEGSRPDSTVEDSATPDEQGAQPGDTLVDEEHQIPSATQLLESDEEPEVPNQEPPRPARRPPPAQPFDVSDQGVTRSQTRRRPLLRDDFFESATDLASVTEKPKRAEQRPQRTWTPGLVTVVAVGLGLMALTLWAILRA